MYIQKYVERSDDAKDIWSLRQTGVYHQVRLSDQQSTCIVISPRQDSQGQRDVLRWMRSQCQTTSCRKSVMDIHQVLQQCYCDGYRAFMSYYDDKIETLVSTCGYHVAWRQLY